MMSEQVGPVHIHVGQPLVETHVPSVHVLPVGQKPLGFVGEHASTHVPSRHT